MAQSNMQKVRRFPQVAPQETGAIPAVDEAPIAPEAPANDQAPKAAPAKARSRRALVFAGVGIIALAAAGYYGTQYLTTGRFIIATDDAYVQGDIATISPKLGGYVAKVNVVANQRVKAGDPLVTLDDGDYRIARDTAQAQIDTQGLTLQRIDAQIVGAQASLERELWRYYQERSQVAPAFRGHGLSETTQRVSLRNLAEYLLRLWVPLRPKRRLTPGDNGASGPEKT